MLHKSHDFFTKSIATYFAKYPDYITYLGNVPSSIRVDDPERDQFKQRLGDLLLDVYKGLLSEKSKKRNTFDPIYDLIIVEQKLQILCRFLLQGMKNLLHGYNPTKTETLYHIKNAYESAKCMYRKTWNKDYKGKGLYGGDGLQEGISCDGLMQNAWYIVSIMMGIFDRDIDSLTYCNPYDKGFIRTTYECDRVPCDNKDTIHFNKYDRDFSKESCTSRGCLVSRIEKADIEWYLEWNEIFDRICEGPNQSTIIVKEERNAINRRGNTISGSLGPTTEIPVTTGSFGGIFGGRNSTEGKRKRSRRIVRRGSRSKRSRRTRRHH